MSPWTHRTIVLGPTPPSAAPGPLLPGAPIVEAAPPASASPPEPAPPGDGGQIFTRDSEPEWRRERHLDWAEDAFREMEDEQR